MNLHTHKYTQTSQIQKPQMRTHTCSCSKQSNREVYCVHGGISRQENKFVFLKRNKKPKEKVVKTWQRPPWGCIIPHVAVKFLELKFEKDALSWQSQGLCDHYYLYVFFSARLCKKYQAKFHETWWSSGTWGGKFWIFSLLEIAKYIIGLCSLWDHM